VSLLFVLSVLILLLFFEECSNAWIIFFGDIMFFNVMNYMVILVQIVLYVLLKMLVFYIVMVMLMKSPTVKLDIL
jgi:hypothetical protein